MILGKAPVRKKRRSISIWMSLVGDRNSCSIIAFKVITEKPYQEAKEICTRYGWRPTRGMLTVQLTAAIRAQGFRVVPDVSALALSNPTLAQFRRGCDRSKTYLVHTQNHVFVVRRGRQIDQESTGPRKRVRRVDIVEEK